MHGSLDYIESWRQVAEIIGLNYSEEFDALFDNPIYHRILREKFNVSNPDQAKKLLDHPMFKKIASYLDIFIIYGPYKNHHFVIIPHQAGEGGAYRIDVSLLFQYALPESFEIRAKNVLDNFINLFSRSKNFSFRHDADLNRMLTIRSGSKVLLNNLFTNYALAQDLKEMFHNSKNFEVNEYRILYNGVLHRDDPIYPDQIRTILDLMVKVGRHFRF